MMKTSWVAVCVVVMVIRPSEALTCFPCEEAQCEPPTGCKWGTQLGVCGCCDTCTPGEGDPCGGPWNVYGRCAEGLTCLQSGPYGETFCTDESDNEILRQKRSLASSRRVGLAKIQAKVHRHRDFGGIPEHIKRLLRAQGVAI